MSTEKELLLRQVVAETLQLPVDEIDDSCSQETIEAWKSLNHLALMSAVEDTFDISFSMEEMAISRAASRKAARPSIAGMPGPTKIASSV